MSKCLLFEFYALCAIAEHTRLLLLPPESTPTFPRIVQDFDDYLLFPGSYSGLHSAGSGYLLPDMRTDCGLRSDALCVPRYFLHVDAGLLMDG